MDRNPIIAEAISRITSELIKDQTDEQFCMLLEKYGLTNLIPQTAPYFFDTQKNGNIIMFGDSKIKTKEIHGCLKSYGISKDRFEHIPYDEVTNYNFKNLEYNNNYRLYWWDLYLTARKEWETIAASLNGLQTIET